MGDYLRSSQDWGYFLVPTHPRKIINHHQHISNSHKQQITKRLCLACNISNSSPSFAKFKYNNKKFFSTKFKHSQTAMISKPYSNSLVPNSWKTWLLRLFFFILEYYFVLQQTVYIFGNLEYQFYDTETFPFNTVRFLSSYSVSSAGNIYRQY